MVRGIVLSVLLSLMASKVFCAVEPSELHEPQIMVSCGKVSQHVEVDTGEWSKDTNHTAICTTDKEVILKYCKTVYPTLDVRNIVKAKKAITFDDKNIIPYRCLVGNYEADALVVPRNCNFKHLHFDSKCSSEDEWKQMAAETCFKDDMHLNTYGMLLPCGTDMFTGVELVCCKVDSVPSVTAEPTIKATTQKPLSLFDKLKLEVSKVSNLFTSEMAGCDRKKYHDKRQQQEDGHRKRMHDLLTQWEQSEKRYELLKGSDAKQAKELMSESLSHFKRTMASLDDQDNLERERLREEHQQCVQIDLNNKKVETLDTFIKAMQEETPDASKILDSFKTYLQFCDQDRVHNLRYLEYMRKHHPEQEEQAVETLRDHLQLIESRVNNTITLLFNLPEVARQLKPTDLPLWVPELPTLPTEKPATTTEKPATTTEQPIPTDRPAHTDEHENDLHSTASPLSRLGVALKMRDPEDEPENEEQVVPKRHKSSATFAAVVGLSCGALVIMIVIVVAMVVRKSRYNATKTVLVEGEGDPFLEKRHLDKMQKNGYENPTYKFYR